MTNQNPTTAISPEFREALANAPLMAPRTAGALPSSRTFNMVTAALESGSEEHLAMELKHTRAHYESLEYALADEENIVAAIIDALKEGDLPQPQNLEETLALTARVYHKVVLDVAYETAHGIGFFMEVLGLNVQEALRVLYADTGLDFSDPEREVTDEKLAAFFDGLGADD